MKNQRTSLRKRFTKGLASIAYTAIVIATPFIGAGCASYGDLKGSREVTESFTSYETKADQNYFIAGSKKDSPDAILGLDNKYTLDNPKFWHPVDFQVEGLQDLVGNMKDKASESNTTPYGANVMVEGKDIGDWYSTTPDTIVKMKDGTRVIIYAPTAVIGGGGSGDSGGSGDGGGGEG